MTRYVVLRHTLGKACRHDMLFAVLHYPPGPCLFRRQDKHRAGLHVSDHLQASPSVHASLQHGPPIRGGRLRTGMVSKDTQGMSSAGIVSHGMMEHMPERAWGRLPVAGRRRRRVRLGLAHRLWQEEALLETRTVFPSDGAFQFQGPGRRPHSGQPRPVPSPPCPAHRSYRWGEAYPPQCGCKQQRIVARLDPELVEWQSSVVDMDGRPRCLHRGARVDGVDRESLSTVALLPMIARRMFWPQCLNVEMWRE